MSAVSCSGYNRIRKSNDGELKYQKAIEYYDQGKYGRTVELLYDVGAIYGGTSKGDTIAYYFGAALYKQGDFTGSAEIFEKFRTEYVRSSFLEEVEYMYAKGFYYASPRAERDQTNTRKAIVAINEYLNRYPNSSKKEILDTNLEELTQKIYDKSLMNARLYYDIGYYNSAVIALENAIKEYPETNHRELISYLIVRSHYMYARNSVEKKQRQRYLDMQDAYYSFLALYPESRFLSDVNKMQGEAQSYLSRFEEVTTAVEGSMVADTTYRRLSRKELRLSRKSAEEGLLDLSVSNREVEDRVSGNLNPEKTEMKAIKAREKAARKAKIQAAESVTPQGIKRAKREADKALKQENKVTIAQQKAKERADKAEQKASEAKAKSESKQ